MFPKLSTALKKLITQKKKEQKSTEKDSTEPPNPKTHDRPQKTDSKGNTHPRAIEKTRSDKSGPCSLRKEPHPPIFH